MRNFLLAAAFAAAVYFALAGAGRPGAPEVFVISLQKQRDFERRDVWYLQYALDGRIEQAVFYSPSRANDYLEYLKRVGFSGEGEYDE
jgi:hypothetical protein